MTDCWSALSHLRFLRGDGKDDALFGSCVSLCVSSSSLPAAALMKHRLNFDGLKGVGGFLASALDIKAVQFEEARAIIGCNGGSLQVAK